MRRINEIDGALMSISAETQERFEIGPESGEPNGDCVFAMVNLEGYISSSWVSGGKKDPPSMGLLYRLVHPGAGGGIISLTNAARFSKISHYYYSKV